MTAINWTAADVPLGTSGPWVVSRETVNAWGATMGAIKGFQTGRCGPREGEVVTILRRGMTTVMSDTSDEYRDHVHAILQAKGRVLIHGLGLGCYLNAVMMRPEVEHATIVEKSEDVLKLVAPYYRAKFGDRVEILHDDAFTWKPPAKSSWAVAWHDIWDGPCSDNLEEMAQLHRRFGRRVEWQGSWARDQCERLKKNEASWR